MTTNVKQITKSTLNALPQIIITLLVAGIALLPRATGLDIFLTADEPKSWFGRALQFLNALTTADWAATFDSPAPGVTTMWAGSIGLWLDYARQGFPDGLTTFLAAVPFDPLDPAILPLIRWPGVWVAVFAAAATFWWGRAFLGEVGALLVALLLALNPFILALSRILGHDALVTLFMWLALLTFLRAVTPWQNFKGADKETRPPRRLNRRFIIISGIFGGLAFLTKYPALSLGAFIALTMLLIHLRSGQPWRDALRHWFIDVMIWSVAAGLVFVILWPAMWVDPLTTVQAIFADAFRASGSPHPKGSFFLGEPVADPGLSFYLLVALFKMTPLVWGGLVLLIISLFWRGERTITRPQWRIILTLFLFGLFYGLLVTIGGKKQDRYILPALPPFLALAGLGYSQFLALVARRWQFVAVALLLAVQVSMIWPHHPYYFTYYNPLLGGGPRASDLIQIGWGEGMDEAARWLNAQEDVADMEVVAWYSTTFEPYFDGRAIYKIGEEKISRTAKPGLAADYVVFYINQLQREYPSVGALQFFQHEPPWHIVQLHGIDYAWIYPSIKMQHVIEEEARLVGQAELLGYNLFDEDNNIGITLPTGDATVIQLYWEWQGKAPTEPLGLSLVDRNGYTWGWGNLIAREQAPLPFEEWQEGMVVYDDFALVVFPGTPPGDYILKVWIDRPSTGEVVGVFPANENDMRLTVSRPKTPIPAGQLGLETNLSVAWQNGMRFLGLNQLSTFEAPWLPDETRELRLYWAASRNIDQDYPLTLSLKDEGGTIRATWSGQPALGNFPTSRWRAKDIIRDPWLLTLPTNVPPGDYHLILRVANENSLQLVPVTVGGRPRTFEPPTLDLPLSVIFGNKIELVGVQGDVTGEAIQATSGESLPLALIWRTETLLEADYTLTLQLLDEADTLILQRDQMPLAGAAPTTTWASGEVLIDSYTLNLPPDLPSGDYQLLIAFYLSETGERLPTDTGSDHIRVIVKVTR